MATESWREYKRHRSPEGVEFYHYPSALAQRCWYYVRSLGRARVRPGPRKPATAQAGFLLHYVRRGTLRHTIRDRHHAVGAGSVCLMDFSEPHTHDNTGSRTAEVWWVLFGGRDLAHLFTELRADREPVFQLLDARRFEQLFLELQTLIQTQPRGCEAKAFALLAALLAELFAVRAEREYQVNLVGRRAVLPEPVRKAIDYMARFHAKPELGLKQLCDAAGLSLRHFTRSFRSAVGITPMQYLNRYRVEQAKQLLATTDKPVEHIAQIVGASNQSYFAYLFRRETGQTPRAYRARVARRR